MRPDLKWLVIKGQLTALQATTLGPSSLPHPFKPLGIMFNSDGRVKGRLTIADEPLANAEGDLDAQFGQAGARCVFGHPVREGILRGFLDMGRRVKIRLADLHVDDVLTLTLQFFG